MLQPRLSRWRHAVTAILRYDKRVPRSRGVTLLRDDEVTGLQVSTVLGVLWRERRDDCPIDHGAD